MPAPWDGWSGWSQSALNPTGSLWACGEYLMWWIKDGPLPTPLVTGTTGNTPTSDGSLNRTDTVILFGAKDLEYHQFSGARLSAGFPLAPALGVEASAFLLEQRSATFSAVSDEVGNPVFAEPFIDAVAGAERSFIVAFPDSFAGGISVDAPSRLWGAEGSLSFTAYRHHAGHVALLGGIRYADLDEEISISDFTTILDLGIGSFLNTTVGPGNTLASASVFDTRNQFYGGQLGARTYLSWGHWTLSAATKLGLGTTRQAVAVTGASSLISPAGVVLTAPGSLLATSTNIGRITHHQFSVIPEVTLNLGYQITDSLCAFVGYNLLYWTNVVRPGNQINRIVNLTQVPTSGIFGPLVGPAQPAPLFQVTDFWAQGLNIGLELRY